MAEIEDLAYIRINAVQLASELADKELDQMWKRQHLYEIPITVTAENGDTMYSPVAQGVFNDLYDEFYLMIEESRVD